MMGKAGIALLACVSAFISCDAMAEPVEFSKFACEKREMGPDINEIVKGVFIDKFQQLAETEVLPKGFWTKTKDLGFAICDNGGSYDTRVFYGKGVVFDLQMILYLLAQSRAMMVGRYIGLESQFVVYEDLVNQFVLQTEALNGHPLDIVKAKAMALGTSDQTYEGWMTDEEYQRREQTLFLLSLYFLSAHERCHVALDHEGKLAAINSRPAPEQTAPRQELEIQADACAIDIINADEAQSRQSPISFFAVMMTISTQAIVARNLGQKDEQTHPGTRTRLAAAKQRVLAFIEKSGSGSKEKFGATIEGTAAFFDGLLESYSVPR